MKTVFLLAKLVKVDVNSRGLISEISEETGLERHTISALLHNTVKYISLDSIGRICDYLVTFRGVDPDILPGALFGKEQSGFWRLLAERTHVSFCLATRRPGAWPDNDYVTASDAHMQGVLVGQVSSLDPETADELDEDNAASRAADSMQDAPEQRATESDSTRGSDSTARDGMRAETTNSVGADTPDNDDDTKADATADQAGDHDADNNAVKRQGAIKRVFSDPYLIPAPRWEQASDQDTWVTIHDGQERAVEVYRESQGLGGAGVLLTLGSVKVNGVLEVLAGDIFECEPFKSQDDVASPTARSCPFYFRYREDDPCPVSLCGGKQLSQTEAPEKPGIYYETKNGKWKCCPWEEESKDAGFVLYAHRPPADDLQFACGGFSGQATRFLATRFVQVVEYLWPPQFRSADLDIGLVIVSFDIRKSSRGKQKKKKADFDHTVIRIDEEVFKRRLAPEQ